MLSPHDYERVLQTLLRWNRCGSITALSHEGIAALQELIPASAVAVQHLQSNGQPFFSLQNKDWPYQRDEVEFYRRHADEHPLYQHYQDPAHQGRAVRLSDIISMKKYRRHPIYRMCHARLGIAYILSFMAPSGPGRAFAIGFDRTGAEKNFSRRELAMLQVISPHLAQQFHRFELGIGRNRPWRDPTTADWLAGALMVSNREAELLLYLLEGCSNQEIAVQAGISESTVKRHFTNAFAKLNVQNRVQALQLVRKTMEKGVD